MRVACLCECSLFALCAYERRGGQFTHTGQGNEATYTTCMYLCMYVCTYVCVYTCALVCICTLAATTLRPAGDMKVVVSALDPLPCATTLHRNQRMLKPVSDELTSMRKTIVIVILVIVAFVTVIVIFTRVGRSVASRDPLLDPSANPQIRIEGHP